MRQQRTLRTKGIVRQAYAWCLAYFAVKTVAWLVLPELREQFAAAGPKMLPVSLGITVIGTLGWLSLREHPDLLGRLLTALLAGLVIATAVTLGIPAVAPILILTVIFFDYLVPVFLGVAAWSASGVLAKAHRDPPRTRQFRTPISLEGFEAPDAEEDDRRAGGA